MEEDREVEGWLLWKMGGGGGGGRGAEEEEWG